VFRLDNSGQYHSQLLNCFKVTLQNCGLSECWYFQYNVIHSMYVGEKYFSVLSPNLSRCMCMFRCMNHRLPIVYGRCIRFERCKHICKLCTKNSIGVECPFFQTTRIMYIDPCFTDAPNTLKFSDTILYLY
jgi:hypothetical protein